MRRLDTNDRLMIQAFLLKGLSLTEIAKRLGVSKSTVSREISSHAVTKPGYEGSPCPGRKKSFVCNLCAKKAHCGRKRVFYDFQKADSESREARRKPRAKTRLPEEQKAAINAILLDAVRGKRQSLHHAYIANPELKRICSERTIRRCVCRGEFDVKAHELHRYATYKHEYEKPKESKLRDVSILAGRTFDDYNAFLEKHKRSNVAQYDSVIGKVSDRKAILTITLPKYDFQFGILIRKSDPNDVASKIRAVFRKIGKETAREIFAVNLADNGVEFSYFDRIEEMDGERICNAYFTRPYRATDKPDCERCHEFVRYFIPKGKSLDSLTQEKLDWMFSQINSYVRESRGDRTPYELVERRFGKPFLDAIRIAKVEKKKVNLTPIC